MPKQAIKVINGDTFRAGSAPVYPDDNRYINKTVSSYNESGYALEKTEMILIDHGNNLKQVRYVLTFEKKS